LKVAYKSNPRDYKLILQDIAGEVESNSTPADGFGGRRGISATYTKQGSCPASGVHCPDGSIYIGTYSKDQWLSDSVKPHWDEIKEARSKTKGGDGQMSRSGKRRVNAIKREKRKLKKIKAKVAAVKQELKDEEGSGDDKEDNNAKDNAGNAFGGKRTKGKKPGE